MTTKWFEKYSQKNYSMSKENTGDPEFDLFYELSEFDTPINTDAAWNKVKNQIHPKAKAYQVYWKFAAILVLAFTLGVVVFLQYSSPNELKNLTAKQTVSNYQLPDGSFVALDRKGTISLDEDDFLDNRTLNLKGRAYFDVKKGASFNIKTKYGSVEVIGTSFDVDSRNDELFVQVYSGIVSISNGMKSTKLVKGQSAVLKDNSLQISENKSANAQSWRSGEFQFEDQPLKEIIPLLEDYYNIEIRVSKALLECRVTAEFKKQSLDEVIDTISQILNAKYKKSSNKISVSGKGC